MRGEVRHIRQIVLGTALLALGVTLVVLVTQWFEGYGPNHATTEEPPGKILSLSQAHKLMMEGYGPGRLFKKRLGQMKWAKDAEKAWEWFVRRRYNSQGVVPINYRERVLAYSKVNCQPSVRGDLRRASAALFEPTASVWQFVGPQTAGGVQPSGRIIDLAVHPNGQTIFAVSASGGVWKTTNQGQSWYNCTDNKIPSLGCGSIAMDPNNPDVILVGLGEGMTGTGTGIEPLGTGIYRSSDGGVSWSLLPGTGNGTMQFVVDIRFMGDSNTIAAAATGGYGGAGAGLWKSVDGGQTWNAVGNSTGVAIWSISVDPINANNVVLTSLEGDQQDSSAAIYYSTDGLNTFTPATIPFNGAYDQNVGSSHRIELTRARGNPNVLYAMVGSKRSAIHGIWKSTDGGHAWSTLSLTGVPTSGDYTPGQMTYNNCIAVNPFNDNNVLFGSNLRGYAHTGGGQTGSWQAFIDWDSGDNDGLPYVHADHHVIVFDENQTGTIYMGTDGGFYISYDGGRNWEERNAGIVCTQIYRIANHPVNADVLMMGCQDNDKYVRNPGGAWHHYPNSFGDCMEVEVYPSDAQQDAFLGINYNGATMRFTPNGGQDWWFLRTYSYTDPDSGQNVPNNGIPDDEQGAWVAPFFIDQQHPDNIWVCLRHVYRRVYDDQNVRDWTRVLTLPAADGVNSWEYMELSSGVSDRQLYIGYSRYFGEQWSTGLYRADAGDGQGAVSNLTEVALPRTGYLGSLKCDPIDNNTLWITYSDFDLEPGERARIYKSTNRGDTWISKTNNYPLDLPATAIFIDPNDTKTVILGTDIGCYQTTDDGASWHEYGEGLPNTVVTDFAYFEPTRTLRCGTYGRGMWEIALDGASGEPDISVYPETLSFYKETVPNPDGVKRSSTVQRAAQDTIILSDDFETGSLANWEIWSDPSVFDVTWGIDSSYNSPLSVWCAAGGTYAKDPAADYYPGYMNTYMSFGPFSLADATAAQMTFNAWADVGDYDLFGLYVLTDLHDEKQLSTIFEFTGNTGGWVDYTVDFANLPQLGSALGKPQVWVAFQFVSGLHVLGDMWEGAWIDDVYIAKTTGGTSLNAPVGVTATNNLPDKIIVTWNAVAGATHYRVSYSASVDNPAQATIFGDWFDAGTLSFEVTGAEQGTNYYFYVEAKNATQTSPLSSPGVLGSLGTGGGGVGIPTNVSATQHLTDHVRVSWNAATGATQYQVRRAATNNSAPAVDISGWITALAYNDTTADVGVTYYYFVVASNGTVESAPSAGVAGKRIEVVALDAPSGVTASQDQVGRITVTWLAVPDAVEYQVWRTKGSDNAAAAQAVSGWNQVLSFEDVTLEPETIYYFYVKARNALTESVLSGGTAGQAASGSTMPAKTFTITNTGLGALKIASVTPVGGGTWVSVTPPGVYPVSVATGQSAIFAVRVLDKGLASGQYSERLEIACNVSGKSPYPNAVDVFFSNGVDLPDPPALLSPADGATDVPVSTMPDWTDSARADSYDIWLWKTSDVKPTAPTAEGLTVSEYHPPADLVAGTNYNWTVTARNDDGESASPQWSFTTRAVGTGTPEQPTDPSPGNGATGVDIHTNLDWNDAGGSNSYDLYLWKSSTGKPATPTTDGLDTSTYQPPIPLDAETAYRWQVVAHNASGQTAGNTWTFTTAQNSATAPPAGLAASDGDHTYRIALGWNPVAGATHYKVYRAMGLDSEKTALNDWQGAVAFDDYYAEPGVTYYYWVKAARNSEGVAPSALAGPAEGAASDEQTRQNAYKIVYKNCDLEDGTGNALKLTGTSARSTVKILLLKKGIPAGAEETPGTRFVTTTGISSIEIAGGFGKFTTQSTIGKLKVGGPLKSLTAKDAFVRYVEAGEVGSIKMTGAALSTASPPDIAHTSIMTGSGIQTMSLSLTGVVLDHLETEQRVKSVKIATRKFKDSKTKERQVSLAGIGPAANVATEAWGFPASAAPNDSRLQAFSVGSVSVKGGPIVMDSIEAGVAKIQVSGGLFTSGVQNKTPTLGILRANLLRSGTEIITLSARSLKTPGGVVGGILGWSDAPHAMRVLAPGMKAIEGQGGVAGVFMAGYDTAGEPNYSGSIKSIITKTGDILGEAHVSDLRPIKFKPTQGSFVVHTEAP